jgi:hypothetical protein
MQDLSAIAGEPHDVRPVVVEAAFLVSESLYYGPPNEFSNEQWRSLRDPIYQPRLPIHPPGRVFSRDAIQQRGELLAYYQSVITVARARGKQLWVSDSEFWLRPVVWGGGRELASCAWRDTPGEAEVMLASLLSSKDGELFYDVDEGWELRVTGKGKDLLFLEGDPFEGRVHAYFRCDREAVAVQAQQAIANLSELIPWLSEQLGADYWTV